MELVLGILVVLFGAGLFMFMDQIIMWLVEEVSKIKDNQYNDFE